jgi:LuxR family transcriptional regulator, maltose regulon positive regulatory protein
MPKPAAYRLVWSPERITYELYENYQEQVLPVPLESHAWFTWLTTISSFRFSGQQGQLTVRQERGRRGGSYWYAYRRNRDKVAKRYLGRTTQLTLAHLEEVAAQLVASRSSQESIACASSDDALCYQPE